MTHIINDSVCVRFMIRLQMSCDLCPVIMIEDRSVKLSFIMNVF